MAAWTIGPCGHSLLSRSRKLLLADVGGDDAADGGEHPVARYYTEEGTPPGRWIGSAVAESGDGAIAVGDEVSEGQLRRLIGQGHDPVTDRALGSPYRKYPTVTERIERRTVRPKPAAPSAATTEQEA